MIFGFIFIIRILIRIRRLCLGLPRHSCRMFRRSSPRRPFKFWGENNIFPPFRLSHFPTFASEEVPFWPVHGPHGPAHGPAADLYGIPERLVRARYRGTCQQVPPKDRRYRQSLAPFQSDVTGGCRITPGPRTGSQRSGAM